MILFSVNYSYIFLFFPGLLCYWLLASTKFYLDAMLDLRLVLLW
jgi:hypothetical protein